jgi:membrane-bound ClpP family serine protease
VDSKVTLGIGFALLIVAFLVFFFYGNIAPAIVLLTLGVIFVVTGGRHSTSGQAASEGGAK